MVLSNDCPSRGHGLQGIEVGLQRLNDAFPKRPPWLRQKRDGCFARRQKGECLGGGTSNIVFFCHPYLRMI